jgi:hypothetical protein
LRLCLLASYPDSYAGMRSTLSADIVRLSGAPNAWPAEESAWFGEKLLASFNPLEQNKGIAKTGFAHIQNALLGLPKEAAMRLLDEVIKICTKDGPNQWCWELMPVLADARKDAPTAVSIAYVLAERGPRDAEQALRLVDVAKSRLGMLPAKERDLWGDFADLSQAQAYIELHKTGSVGTDKVQLAEALLERLQGSAALRGNSTVDLALLRERQNRSAEAIAIVDAAIKQWPDNAELYGVRLKLALSEGDKEGVFRIAAIANERLVSGSDWRITGENEGFAFVAALGLLMSEGQGWERAAREFLGTKHPNTPYVAMMLYSQMAGKGAQEARQIIERRWTDADPETWIARLREGDVTAFREKLIGYYLKRIPRHEVFSDLEDQRRFAGSDLRHLSMSRQEMLCEAYFYDALLALAERDLMRARGSLKLALNTNQVHFWEHTMAKYLLQQK